MGWQGILYGRIYVDFSFLTVYKVCTKAILPGERSVRIREVKGSNPSRSIKSKTPCLLTRSFLFIQDPEGFRQGGGLPQPKPQWGFGYAAEGTKALPNHFARKPLSETVSYL